MGQFRNWYVRNQDAITWFIIGWCTFAGLDDLINGKYIWAALYFAIAYINYKTSDFRMQ
jgi:hypothetical protein